jgi:hypothetical protein
VVAGLGRVAAELWSRRAVRRAAFIAGLFVNLLFIVFVVVYTTTPDGPEGSRPAPHAHLSRVLDPPD